MNAIKQRWDKGYESYGDTQPEGFQEIHAATVEPIFCEIRKGSKVLDIGCNSGEFMKLLKDAKDCDVFGVDLSEKALKLAEEKGLKVLKGDAEKLPYEDKSFDYVIMRDTLAHIFDPEKALIEVKRVLKDDGVFLGGTPHRNVELTMWEDKAPHHNYYDEEGLMKALQVFDMNFLKVLNGSQMSSAYMYSTMANKPAQLIWKSGGENTKPWEYDLVNDSETLRVWMGPTQPPGDAYYRMIGFGEKLRKMTNTEVGWDKFEYKSSDMCNEWQRKISLNDEGNVSSSVAINELSKVLKIASPWVFQITYLQEVVDFLEFMKMVNPKSKLITEIDDWMFDIPSYNVASHPYRPGSEKERIAMDQIKLSDALFVSTNFLKESLLEIFPGKNIHVVPNSIDFDLWGLSKQDETVRIIYTGCGNHSGDLETIKPVLLQLLEDFPKLEVLISVDFECFQDVKHPRFKVVNKWCDILNYPKFVQEWRGSIGIAPLRDNAFNRAKSNLRWLEYSAMGIPSVMSNVRPFSESVTHGENGYLCKSKKDWYDTLTMLIKNKAKRNEVGLKALSHVKENYDMNKTARKYREILEEVKCS